MISGFEMIWDHKMPKERTIEFNAKLWDDIQESWEVKSARIAQSAPKQWYWTEMVKRCKCIRGRDGKIIQWSTSWSYPEFGVL
jgi:hypothetical protein